MIEQNFKIISVQILITICSKQFAMFLLNGLIGLLTIFLGFFVVTIAYFKWSWLYWKRKNVDVLPVKFPLGNSHNLIMQKLSFGEEIANVYKEYKKKSLRYGGFYFITKPILVMVDLDLIKTIMSKDFQHFTDHGNYINEEADPLTGHLFSLRGQKWRNLRVKLTPTFTSGKMKMMFQTLVDCSHELTAIMDDCANERIAVDIKDVVGRFTTDIIGSCAFGIDCNSLRNPQSEFRKYGVKMFETGTIEAFKTFLGFCFPEFLDLLNVAIIKKDVSSFFMNVVKDTMTYRETNNITRKDFMHLLIQLKNNINIQDERKSTDLSKKGLGTALTINQLAAQAFVFFLAGFETSSTTLTYCFYELATNLKIQQKLREEINSVLKKHNSTISYDALMEMDYMDKCINETLRKYPPVPVLTRECMKTYKIPDSNLIIEKGTQLFLPILGIQHDPEYYADPATFDPERFSPEQKSERHPFAWLPFGEGPRACIGLRFGLMQTKVALTVLLSNYKFTLNMKTKLPLKQNPRNFILSVNGGVWLNIAKIKD